MKTILTNDPSITEWGWSVIDVETKKVKSCGCIKTSPEHKKLRIRKSDDTCRRISEINCRLLKIIKHFGVKMILTELPHGSQNANAMKMIGIVTAIMQTISDSLFIPLESYSEGDAKKFLLNKRSATKQEVMNEIKKLYPTVKWTGTKYKDEAIADSLAIFNIAQYESSTIKILLTN